MCKWQSEDEINEALRELAQRVRELRAEMRSGAPTRVSRQIPVRRPRKPAENTAQSGDANHVASVDDAA